MTASCDRSKIIYCFLLVLGRHNTFFASTKSIKISQIETINKNEKAKQQKRNSKIEKLKKINKHEKIQKLKIEKPKK